MYQKMGLPSLLESFLGRKIQKKAVTAISEVTAYVLSGGAGGT